MLNGIVCDHNNIRNKMKYITSLIVAVVSTSTQANWQQGLIETEFSKNSRAIARFPLTTFFLPHMAPAVLPNITHVIFENNTENNRIDVVFESSQHSTRLRDESSSMETFLDLDDTSNFQPRTAVTSISASSPVTLKTAQYTPSVPTPNALEEANFSKATTRAFSYSKSAPVGGKQSTSKSTTDGFAEKVKARSGSDNNLNAKFFQYSKGLEHYNLKEQPYKQTSRLRGNSSLRSFNVLNTKPENINTYFLRKNPESSEASTSTKTTENTVPSFREWPTSTYAMWSGLTHASLMTGCQHLRGAASRI